MMEFTNFWAAQGRIKQEKDNILSKKDAESFLKILAPFTPHIAEELWSKLKHKKSIFMESWPKSDPKLIQKETFELVIQINGKVRDKVEVNTDISEEEAKNLVLKQEKVKKWLGDKEIKKVIFVKERLINIVI